MERDFKCPRCGEKSSLAIERRPNGNVECLKCFYTGPYVHFMNHPDKPFVRSELDCIDGRECWALTLRLATSVCYKDLKAEFGVFMNPDKSLEIGYVNTFLIGKGYSYLDMRNHMEGNWTVREALDTFKDVKVVLRSINKKKLDPNIHYYEDGVLFTTSKDDDIFNEEVIMVWIRK